MNTDKLHSLTALCRWRGKWLARVYIARGREAWLLKVVAGSWEHVLADLHAEGALERSAPGRLPGKVGAADNVIDFAAMVEKRKAVSHG